MLKDRHMHRQNTIFLDNHCVTVEYKNIRSLRMHVNPRNQSIHLRCPHGTPHEALRTFLHQHRQWINDARQRLHDKVLLKTTNYDAQSLHLHMGKAYTLVLSEAPQANIYIDKQNIHCPNAPLKQRRQCMERWYDQQLHTLIQQRILYWEPFIGKTVAHWSLRTMRTRWGSCTPSTARLRFNRALIKTPFECIDCVVLHEMVHLLEASHNQRFKALMHTHMPQWQSYDRLLNRYLLD